MKRKLFLLSLLFPFFGTAWAQPSLNGCRHITDLSQIKEGAYYYIVSDRTKFNYEVTTPKAIAAYQSGFPNWDEASKNKYFVYWGDLTLGAENFIWKAEEVGNQWAFQNVSNDKYLGVMHKHHPTYPHSSETDMVFSDEAKGFTLTDLSEGEGRWAFTNSEWTSPFTPQRYAANSSYDIAMRDGDSDSNASDAETYGYPGRWHLYELTGATALEDGAIYYIFNDAKNHINPKVQGMAAQQDYFDPKWDGKDSNGDGWEDHFVYYGEFRNDNDGFKWIAEKHGYKWAFKNVQNGEYIGALNGDEILFANDKTTKFLFILTDLSPEANRFFIQKDDRTTGLHCTNYWNRWNNNLSLYSEYGNETNGYATRWTFVKVEDYIADDAENTAANKLKYNFSTSDGGTNIIGRNSVCQDFVITDGVDITIPQNFTATTATYNRSMSNSWGTVCLPYEVSSNSDVTYYTAGSINGDVLTLTSAETVPAGTPAIFKVNGGTFTATSNNVEVLTGAQDESTTDDDIVLHGTLGKLVFDDVTTDTENDYYYISNNKFMHATRKLTVNPFRAYFTMAKGSAPSNGFNIAVDDDSMTAIEALTGEGDTTITAIYTTDGKQLSDLQQGLNIVKLSNGKVQKIMVK